MARINVLDKDTFNKIAAGEVVERPSSVVKELVENSIDAGSREIHVEIQGGGEELIRVLDKGEGIEPDDMLKAFMPHATSKIMTADDLFRISTMGFRGEALSSISSVSRVLMRSRTEGSDGREVYIEGGDLKYEKYSPMDKGTLIEVRDLFYNVPARKKFLKSRSKEAGTIGEILSKIAIAHPEISFSLVSDGKALLKTYGTGDQKDVIRQVYTKKVQENTFPFHEEYDSLRISGFVGNEEISRGNRSQQSIFVNRRLVQSRTITVAAENAFRSFATVSRFPFLIINIDILPEIIDVNIHPQKAEIKFEDDRHIFKVVFDTIHKTMAEGLKRTFDVEPEAVQEETHEQIAADFPVRPVYIDMPVDVTARSFPDTRRQWTDAAEDNDEGSRAKEIPAQPETRPLSSNVAEDAVPMREAKFPMPRIIGQFRSTYILAEIHDELYVFDQHAAHEKINFEKYMRDLTSGSVASQPLLVPAILELSLEDYGLMNENRQALAEAGFLVEDFGDRAISVREVPYFLGEVSNMSYLTDILDNIRNLGKGTREEIRRMRIATAACKASVKAYEPLVLREMEHLIEELRHIDEPFTCPHGRPTMIKYTEKDFEKAFRRIV